MNFAPDYELIIYQPERVNNFIIPRGIVSPLKLEQGVNGIDLSGNRFSVSPDGITLRNGDFLDYNTIPAKAYSITDLQLTASIPETTDDSSKTVFQVTNLSDELCKFIKVDTTLTFRAAYKSTLPSTTDTLPDVFVGQVSQVRSTFEGTDRITTIECSAGRTVKRNSRISYTWPPGTTRQQVISDFLKMIGKQGLPTGNVIPPVSGTKASTVYTAPYLSGYSVQGKTLDEFFKVLESCQMTSYISKGKLFVQPIVYGVNEIRKIPNVFKFTVNRSQIKGQPQPIDGESTTKPSATVSNPNSVVDISLTLYLNTQIGLDSVITLTEDTGEYEGQYKVTSLRHVYDHRGGVYETKLTLTGVRNEQF